MRYIILLIPLLFLLSCSSSKNINSKEVKKIESQEFVDSSVSVKSYESSISSADLKDSETLEEEITETEYKNIEDPKTGEVISTVARVKITKRSKVKNSQSKHNTAKVEKAETLEQTKLESKETGIESKESTTTKKLSNTAIVRWFYGIIVLILGGYIVVKKYFPSIFVKVTKSLKSIIK